MKVRGLFDHFEEYGWETPSREIAARVGLPVGQIVRLDTNASPFRPSGALADLARAAEGLKVNQYPDTSYLDLREALSRYTGKGVERFVVTNGADEGLDIATKVLLDPGDEVVVPTPTYSMYRIAATIMGARVVSVERRPDFGLDVERMLAAVGPRTRAIFLCNPNNPTGNLSPIEEVERLAGSGVAVVVDEAYFEYCGRSAIDLTDRLENVVVCRTLSKAFSMAGVRVGYLVAKDETTKVLNAVRPPNSLSVISLFLAQAALTDHREEMRRDVEATVGERGRLLRSLAEIEGVRTHPSETNFVLFSVPEAEAVHSRLMSKGLVLRNLSRNRGTEGCLRATVATPEVNERLVAGLRDAVAPGQKR